MRLSDEHVMTLELGALHVTPDLAAAIRAALAELRERRARDGDLRRQLRFLSGLPCADTGCEGCVCKPCVPGHTSCYEAMLAHFGLGPEPEVRP